MAEDEKKPQRYDQILKIIDDLKPKTIIEIGVARIVRAREMSVRAMMALGGGDASVHYTGYDVFDGADEDFHKAAYNHKRVEPEHWCRRKLWWIQQPASKGGNGFPNFRFDTVKGDTRLTLHGRDVRADLAFIDGDHRAEVIVGDYRALRHCKVVILDDYYEADARGIPDIDKLGCNTVVEQFADDPDVTFEILPHADPGKYEGVSKLVVVRRR